MIKIITLLFCSLTINLLFLCSAKAQTITVKTAETIFEDVKLAETITLDNEGFKTELKSVSHGLRQKKVFLLAIVKIYVAEFFAAEPTKLKKTPDEILNSLKSAGPLHLRLTVSRDLSGSQISESFKEALKTNDIDLENTSKELLSVLKTVNEIQKIKTGEVFSLTAFWKDNVATLLIQRPDQTIQKISGPEKFATDLFSIWFGKPADPKLEDLKKALLNNHTK